MGADPICRFRLADGAGRYSVEREELVIGCGVEGEPVQAEEQQRYDVAGSLVAVDKRVVRDDAMGLRGND